VWLTYAKSLANLTTLKKLFRTYQDKKDIYEIKIINNDISENSIYQLGAGINPVVFPYARD